MCKSLGDRVRWTAGRGKGVIVRTLVDPERVEIAEGEAHRWCGWRRGLWDGKLTQRCKIGSSIWRRSEQEVPGWDGSGKSKEEEDVRSSNGKPGGTAAVGRNRGQGREVGLGVFEEVVAAGIRDGGADVEGAGSGRGEGHRRRVGGLKREGRWHASKGVASGGSGSRVDVDI